jgi:hypothetical protein
MIFPRTKARLQTVYLYEYPKPAGFLIESSFKSDAVKSSSMDGQSTTEMCRRRIAGRKITV